MSKLNYQFKFLVANSKPPIWRRVVVSSEIDFETLHYIILASTDSWSGLHHYSFHFTNKKEVGDQVKNILENQAEIKARELNPKNWKSSVEMFYKMSLNQLSIGRDEFYELPTSVKVSELFLKETQRCRYDYNSANAIELEIILEKILPSSKNPTIPVCLKAVRQFPLEDMNGLWEYEDILKILAKPKSKRRIPEEYLDFIDCLEDENGNFDSEKTDLESINENLKNLSDYKSNTDEFYNAGKEIDFDPLEQIEQFELIQNLISIDSKGKPYLDYSKLAEASNSAEEKILPSPNALVNEYKTLRLAVYNMHGELFRKYADQLELRLIMNILQVKPEDLEKSETIFDHIQDYFTYEITDYRNTSYIRKYAEEGNFNDTEKQSIDACLRNYTGLFEITKVDYENRTLQLTSLTNSKNPNIKIIDVGLSTSVSAGSILFTRIIPFDKINMTSGFSFVFLQVVKKTLVDNYNKLIAEHVGSKNFDRKKWEIMFKLNRSMGSDVIHTTRYNAQNS